MMGECEWVLFGAAIGASIALSHVSVLLALLWLDRRARKKGKENPNG